VRANQWDDLGVRTLKGKHRSEKMKKRKKKKKKKKPKTKQNRKGSRFTLCIAPG
jgi:hypothetical protein